MKLRPADSIRRQLVGSSDPYRRSLGSADRMIVRSWFLAHPGPARFGWWSIGIAGDGVFLGRSRKDCRP